MIGYLTLRSEYSFKKCYGFLDRLFNEYSDSGFIGIADEWNTFSFYRLQVLCNAHNNENESEWLSKFNEEKKKLYKNKGYRLALAKNIKPIYGIRVTVVEDATIKVKPRGQFGVEYIIIAKNIKGIRQIYKLTSIGTQNFYYRENISSKDIDNLDENVFVIPTEKIISKRFDYYGVTLSNKDSLEKIVKEKDVKFVAIDNNFYPTMKDRDVYECFAGRNKDNRTYAQHILTNEEKEYYFENNQIINIKEIADNCDHFKLDVSKPAHSVKNENMEELIYEGAIKKGLDLFKEPYKERIEYEIKTIREKKFEEYFLIVSDIIRFAKKKSLVGVGRGSAAGSLVSYCLDITDVDPIKYDLLFSRFIAPERKGEPDIDSDFSDSYRSKVVKYIEKTYGKENVKTISNVTMFRPKSAITEFSKSLKIPEWEVENVKDSIIDRAGGDNRASFCISDTFEETDHGKALIEKYPEIKLVERIEGHANNKGKHAAGVIVSNTPLHDLCGINNRDQSVFLNKNDAEGLGILKIDILGLRTLSVLESVADLVGFEYNDYYKIDLEDSEVYKNIFHTGRVSGVFQFEGGTMMGLNKEAPMDCFEDIACAQALARPGALASGGAAKFVAIKNGRREPFYYCKEHKEITKETYGITVFQETMMRIAREIANLSWEEVSFLRAAASKSYGDEWFAQFKPKFINGCIDHCNLDEKIAEDIWKDIASSGSYSFNKSHAVSYGMISFWTAWAKNYYPMEFIASTLNHAKSDNDCLKILREFYEKDGLKYEAVNPDTSMLEWSVQDGKLIGGLMNINGFGKMKALSAIKMRKGEIPFTPSVISTMFDPETPYDILYPADFHFYFIYDNPYEYTGDTIPISYASQIQDKGEYWCIGKIIYFDDINLNDYAHIQKRGNEITDGFDKKITFRIEDDTDTITMIVSRFEYDRLRSEILNSKLGETWLIVKGDIIFDHARIFMVKEVANLSKQVGLQPYDREFSKIRRHIKKC